MTKFLGLLMAAVLFIGTQTAAAQEPANANPNVDRENMLVMQLKDGPVVIKLRPDLAPNHVARIKELTRQGFYDGIVFHRVIEGFMAQTGDPTGTGRGGSGQNLDAEFTSTPFERGTVGMARGGHDINSADSQFFINFAPTPFLNGQYTVVGEVVSGMERVDNITRGEPPANPDKIIIMKVLADVPMSDPSMLNTQRMPGPDAAE